MGTIQVIRSERTNGLQVRVFRGPGCVMTRFFAFLKYGGEPATWVIAEQELAQLEREAVRQYGPAIRMANDKGHHHRRPSMLNHSQVPGIALRYRYRKGTGQWGVHVTWQEGDGPDRRQKHREFSLATHGPFGAVSAALAVRAEKTGLPQAAPDMVWLRLCEALEPEVGRPALPTWDGP